MIPGSGKVLIAADLEGIIGVDDIFSQSAKGLMVDELVYIVNRLVALDEGCAITISNIHNNGQLISSEDIGLDGVSLIKGIKALSECDWDFDCALLVGMHGKRNSGGFFDHTFRADILHMQLENDDKDIGEVYSFRRWFESKGIPVILVSGEGNFECEIEGEQCVIHKTALGNSIEEQYRTLGEAIEKCLAYRHKACFAEDTQRVLVEVDNSDKFPYLSEDGFIVEGNAVAFDNLEHFFSDIYKFASILNSSGAQIIKTNYELAKIIRDMQIGEDEYPELKAVFSKPVNLITKADRESILRRINHEVDTKQF